MELDLGQLMQSGLVVVIVLVWNSYLQKDLQREREERIDATNRLLSHLENHEKESQKGD
jgi:hypothetical protein